MEGRPPKGVSHNVCPYRAASNKTPLEVALMGGTHNLHRSTKFVPTSKYLIVNAYIDSIQGWDPWQQELVYSYSIFLSCWL